MTKVSLMLSSSVRTGRAAARDGDEPRDVVRAIADLVSLVEPRLLALWKATEMTFGQRRVLRHLREGPKSAGVVAESLGVSAPTLTRQLAKLEARGLLVRTLDLEDRRRVLVTLSPAGRRALADHRVFAGSPVAMAARELTSDQRRELVDSLERLVSAARRRDGQDRDV
jgi:DNA-binding MarR family transcriptional regulator